MKMLGRKKIFVLSYTYWQISVAMLLAQDIDYSRFEGKKVRTSLATRLEKPYFKSYGVPGLGQYVIIPPAGDHVFAGPPEDNLVGVYRSTSKNELSSFFEPGSKVNFKDYKSLEQIPVDSTSLERNFLLLNHKLTFTLPAGDLAIINYTEYADSIPQSPKVLAILKKGGKWLCTRNKSFAAYLKAMQSITSDQFWSLYKKSPLETYDYQIPERIRKSVKDADGTLNLLKLYGYIRKNGVDF